MIVVAIPTIAERGDLAEQTAKAWHEHTCQPVHTVISHAGDSWAAGLNDVWAQTRELEPDIFVCASDDMIPEDDNWLPPLAHHLAQGMFPAPCVIDPRFTNFGGHRSPVDDGTPSDGSSFPVIAGGWGELVFPLPADLHYYADNLFAVLLERAGYPCVAVPSSRIRHLCAREGRGAGFGDESTRMLVDSVRYSEALEALGIDRVMLPAGQRGPCWEPHWLEQGRALIAAAG